MLRKIFSAMDEKTGTSPEKYKLDGFKSNFSVFKSRP